MGGRFPMALVVRARLVEACVAMAVVERRRTRERPGRCARAVQPAGGGGVELAAILGDRGGASGAGGAIRRHGRTGRPWGGVRFLGRLEKRLGRRVRPGQPGRPRKRQGK